MLRHTEQWEGARTDRRGPRFSAPIAMTSIAIALASLTNPADWAAAEPQVHQQNLSVRTVVSGLTTPITMAFLGEDDLFVLEKNTGQVKRVVNGSVQSTVLDLAVNFGSERGLLGIALHPDFDINSSVYLYWTESSTGVDTEVLAETPLLGNRVDRYEWDGTSLTFVQNIIQLRALQPENPPHETREFGNHDGGVLRFGPDGKLYVVIGDNGRRGQLQNLADGPFGPGESDDQFGGPEPDDAHLTGVVLRLEDDGEPPVDNPFFEFGAQMGGEVGANLQKVFAYGIRNSFGMDFDPRSGALWIQINGDDSFDEIHRVEPGTNSGWIQVMGPLERVAQFKAIETDSLTIDPVTGRNYFGLQQSRWSPDNIADTPDEARSRLFMLPGAEYHDPEFSWKYAVAPGAIGFVDSRALGGQFDGDLIVGASTPLLAEGYLFRFQFTGNRQTIVSSDQRLRDGVADNNHKHDLTESESLLFGSGFGVTTDIRTGPDGNLYVVSLSDGAIYEIHRRDRDHAGDIPGSGNGPGNGPGNGNGKGFGNGAGPGNGRGQGPQGAVAAGSNTLRLDLDAGGPVTIGVYDVSGRLVRTLVDGELAAGVHEFSWDGLSGSGRVMPAGVYFAQIQGNTLRRLHKLVQVR